MWRISISSWWSGWSSKLFGLLIHQRHGDRAVGSGGFCLSPVIIPCPTSALLAEIFLQYFEHSHIINILQKHHIIDYHRYVDEILIIGLYNEKRTNIENTLQEFNLLHPNFQYIIEKQTNKTLNFLNITIKNVHNKLTFDIYRKTTTDIIHNSSCHPTGHKNMAIRYLLNRMNT
jgi:hypothetical protein